MHVCMCVKVYTRAYACCIHRHIHIHIHTHIPIHIQMHIQIHIHIPTHTCASMHVYAYVSRGMSTHAVDMLAYVTYKRFCACRHASTCLLHPVYKCIHAHAI